jgi:hypothetical protein
MRALPRVLGSTSDTPAFEEFRASIYLDVIPREFPFSEGDESTGRGYSSIVNQPTTFQAIYSKSPIDLSPHLLG